MSGVISPSLLSQLSQHIEAWMGLFFPPERWGDLERKLHAAAPAFGCADAEACARLLMTAPMTKQQLDLLAVHLTVGETYFFREPRSLEVLERQILPELILERRGVDQRLRVWSAACCTGEEPYSIAIILHRLLPDLPSWKAAILATDISPRFLRRAKEGVYGQWSFRSVSLEVQEQHFRRTPSGHYAIRPALQKMVSLAQLNLAKDVYPSSANNTVGLDIVFCRNVLIYFTAERTRRIIEQLYHTLNDGGWLIVSPVETAFAMDSPFTPVQFPGVTLFRKGSDRRTVHFTFGVNALPASPEPTESIAAFLSVPEAQCDIVVAGAPLTESERTLSQENAAHGAWPAPPAPQPSPHLYEEARTFYTRGQYAEVINLLGGLRWGEEHENSPPGPVRERIIVLLARAYANQGQLAEAQTWCEQALAINKFDPGLHYLRATILLACGREAEARLSLTRALYLDQRFVLAHFTLGNLARQRGEFKEASKHFANALALLQQYQPEDILPESEGMSARRLAQIIADMSGRV